MKSKKNLIVICTIVLFGIILGAVYIVNNPKSAVMGSSTQSQSEFINEWGKTEITIGIDQEYPPMTFRNENGEIVGFDIDMAKEAFQRIGLTPIFKPTDWSTIVMSLQNKDIDIVWSGMTITSERESKINFTKPYFKGSYVYILKSDSEVNSKGDLAGKIVGVQAGSSNEESLIANSTELNLKEIKSYSSFEESLLDLNNGRVDAVFVDGTYAFYYINSKKMSYKTIEEVNLEEGAGVGVRKSDTGLLNELNDVLDAMKQDGAATEISNKWFGQDLIKR